MKQWQCVVCGWVYDEAQGDPEHGIAPGTLWADVPEDFICPECGVAKRDFVMMESDADQKLGSGNAGDGGGRRKRISGRAAGLCYSPCPLHPSKRPRPSLPVVPESATFRRLKVSPHRSFRPDWPARGRGSASEVINMQFSELGLSAELLRAIGEQGYTTPTPVQRRPSPTSSPGATSKPWPRPAPARPPPSCCRSCSACPSPWSALQKVTHTAPRVLVLVPTRELAAQVLESVRTYGAHTGLRSLAVFGGVGINPQIQTMRRGIDILVATPGRLLDHLGQRTVDLSKVQTLVLDEADRMFDMGFIRDIRRIIEKLPKVRQNLMFSATFAAEVRELAHAVLQNPAWSRSHAAMRRPNW
jgi:rubredoxin